MCCPCLMGRDGCRGARNRNVWRRIRKRAAVITSAVDIAAFVLSIMVNGGFQVRYDKAFLCRKHMAMTMRLEIRAPPRNTPHTPLSSFVKHLGLGVQASVRWVAARTEILAPEKQISARVIGCGGVLRAEPLAPASRSVARAMCLVDSRAILVSLSFATLFLFMFVFMFALMWWDPISATRIMGSTTSWGLTLACGIWMTWNDPRRVRGAYVYPWYGTPLKHDMT